MHQKGQNLGPLARMKTVGPPRAQGQQAARRGRADVQTGQRLTAHQAGGGAEHPRVANDPLVHSDVGAVGDNVSSNTPAARPRILAA